ncbi:Flavoprotein transmembrane component [Niveomyces insectorum RCEF 264]|uniref:ferric-chelate reductase (NADPH) n=1 Tax=Niveomyces insectorum RCEF 264 TaxID=1081102 RepID=A0A162MMY9_9HYPO|nr:Flavoprotein transmembrane component [Niveomyces insectorum RCEF 264]
MVYFFVAMIAVFILAHALTVLLPQRARRSGSWLKLAALVRTLSYRDVRLGRLRWNSPSLGVLLVGAAGLTFSLAIVLGPKPYYWPNTATVKFGDSPPLANRSGYLSLACLPFIFLFGAKANLVTTVTGIAPEKLIIFHLFSAWGMFLLALLHTFPFIVYHRSAGDLMAKWSASAQWLTGVIAICAEAWLTFMSLPFVRHRYYEFFKAMHFLAAAVFVGFLFIHCDFTLTSWDYFVVAGCLYFASLFFAVGRTYLAHGLLRATIVLEAEHTMRISIPATFTWRPGQHLYLRFPTLGLHALTAHPFTICSIPSSRSGGGASKAPTTEELVFHVKPRGGMTGRLAARARKQPAGVTLPVFIEGPYGGMPQRWDEGFDKTLVVAGGAGAGFSLGLIEDWIARYHHNQENQAGSGRELIAVISSRDPGMRRWLVGALHQIIEKYTATSSATSGGAVATNGSTTTPSPHHTVQGVQILVHETGIWENKDTERGSHESATGVLQPASPRSARTGNSSPGLRSSGSSSSRGNGGGDGGGNDHPEKISSEHVSHADNEKGVGAKNGVVDTGLTDAQWAATVDMLRITVKHGQADLPALVRANAAGSSAGSVGVTVCGPSAMAHDVATACAAEQQRILRGAPGAAEVWLHQEGFSN